MLSAGVMGRTAKFGPDFDHMTLLVSLDEEWLVDVGFGDSFIEPLRLDEHSDQVQARRAYRIVEDGELLTLMQRDEGGEWSAQYRFNRAPHAYADYAGMCKYHQTSSESHFTQRRICSRLTPGGRVTLSDMTLITTSADSRNERALFSPTEYA